MAFSASAPASRPRSSAPFAGGAGKETRLFVTVKSDTAFTTPFSSCTRRSVFAALTSTDSGSADQALVYNATLPALICEVLKFCTSSGAPSLTR
jgi:hypothetical protein